MRLFETKRQLRALIERLEEQVSELTEKNERLASIMQDDRDRMRSMSKRIKIQQGIIDKQNAMLGIERKPVRKDIKQ